MILQEKTLEKLRLLINEETEYRSGPKLVQFFNELGFRDTYEQGFPSRWMYTDEKLKAINGTPELDKCIKKLFAPVNFIGRFNDLDGHIKDFNQYLAFDKWRVVRNEERIHFMKSDKIKFDDAKDTEAKEVDFLKKEFDDLSIDSLGLDVVITDNIKLRLDEIKNCLTVDAPLSVIFLCGSTLEGILLGIALKSPKSFIEANSAPKDKEGKVIRLQFWSLNSLIDTAYEIGLIKEDVRKFSHSLRGFRNYIHPYEQVSSRFNPDKHTAKISWQVLKAAIFQLTKQ